MQQKTIVIVDDDPDILAAHAETLKAAGYQVFTANDRDGGLETIRTTKPDLIALDVMMEGWQDGFLIARELKQETAFQHTPILLMTAINDKTGVDFKSQAGNSDWMPVEAFLEKPVDPNQLLQTVEQLLADKD